MQKLKRQILGEENNVANLESGKILASTSTCIQGHSYTAEVKDIASPQPVYRESTSWPF